MGSKRRCPSCGAKNDAAARRCRLCTEVINADAPEADNSRDVEPVEESPLAGHFDAGVIDRQVQPARSRFGGTSGLGARLAAAGRAPTPPTSPTPPSSTTSPEPPSLPPFAAGSDPPPWADEPGAAAFPPPDPPHARPIEQPSAQPTEAPLEQPGEQPGERFDPDALFRDMDRG